MWVGQGRKAVFDFQQTFAVQVSPVKIVCESKDANWGWRSSFISIQLIGFEGFRFEWKLNHGM